MVELNKKHRKENKKRLKNRGAPKSVEVKYRKQLLSLSRSLKEDSNELIIPILKKYESQYTGDSYATTLEEAFDVLRGKYVFVNSRARIIANSFVEDNNSVNRKRFYSAMNKAIGVDLANIVSNENLTETLNLKVRENVSLIKSIPEEYFKKIENIVLNGVVKGDKASSMMSQIKELGYSTDKRARFIARDQTAKLNASLDEKRARNVGAEEYVWRTSEDDRVRDSHSKNNGKVFRYDDPPKDTGHPGQDFQCRCTAEPIIKL